MDRLIAQYPAVQDGDLVLCRGVAYQSDMNYRMAYDSAYFEKYRGYARSAIAEELNDYRVQMARRNLRGTGMVLDIGIGSGAFINAARENGFSCWGFDVNPEAVKYLQDRGLYYASPKGFDVLTFWDSIEHIDEPAIWFEGLRSGGLVLVSVPIFGDLRRVRESKHYKPGEHLYYWTRDGFIDWMSQYGFRWIEYNTHESEIGRDSIASFAFKKS